MKKYSTRCKKNTTNKKSSFKRTKQNRIVLVSSCAKIEVKKSRFMKNQEIH